MTRTPRRPVVMWTPLPPETSGIADYSYELLEAMSAQAEVTAVSRDPEHARTPPGVRLVGPDDADRVPGAAHVYQMGNNTEYHRWIHRRALAVPGVVVLHDTSLLDFTLSDLGGIDSPAFRDEARYAHGPIWGERDDPALLYGWPSVDVDGVKHLDRLTLTMERRIAEASLGLIVHDPFRAGWLRKRYPDTPVATVASGAPVLDDDGKRGLIRARFGWTEDNVVFGVFGGFTRIKRILVAILAFAQVRRRWPQARLLIAGHPREREIADEARALIAELGVGDAVRMTPSPPLDEFQDMIVSTDAVIGLRWPTAGETSAVMMRTFAAGRLFITTDLPQHRHFDPAFCRLVPVDPADEARELLGHLERVAASPEEARAAGALARQYVRDHASWPGIAAAYLDAVERATAPAPVSPRHVLGANVFADVRAGDARGDRDRDRVALLAGSPVDITFTGVNARRGPRARAVPRVVADLRPGKQHPVDIWLVEPDDFHVVPEHALDRYTIAAWDCDLPLAPRSAIGHLGRVDEIWAPSSFSAAAFRTITDKTVTVVPHAVPHRAPRAGGREAFGLPDDAVLVLGAAGADPHLDVTPLVQAFREARPDGAHLVIDTAGIEHDTARLRALAAETADLPASLVATRTRGRALDLIAACDIYASLHRSIGFGQDLAEAMAHGKPVVATGFGGNMDYMRPGAAAVIGFGAYPVPDSAVPFSGEFAESSRSGAVWADPDVDQAARWLRTLAANRGARQSMGRAAVEAVHAVCGAPAVELAITRRLNAI